VWDNQYQNEALIDDFGIGDGAPGAPSVKTPALFGTVQILRPLLEVWNAEDFQSDPLTYAFEIYSDESLLSQVAQVPSVASGARSTAWQVDVNLDNNAQYWWRVRANDGSNDGPWMVTSTFYVNETNAPPNVIGIAGPPKGATLRTATGILSWFPATDPDVGDEIVTYHIQIADDTGFTQLKVDAQFEGPNPPPSGDFVSIGRPLYMLSGYESMGMISNYFWRIRAQDSRFAWSAWTAPNQWFIYGVTPPNPASMTKAADGRITMTWDVGTENCCIQWTPSLNDPWQTIVGPIDINNWTFTPDGNRPTGFYRVVGE
jgi:hypothetical protein